MIVQAMFSRAQSWGWVTSNPAKAVQKPSSKRERAVVCLEPARVEAIRDDTLATGRSYAALIVSLVASRGCASRRRRWRSNGLRCATGPCSSSSA